MYKTTDKKRREKREKESRYGAHFSVLSASSMVLKVFWF
jgi:hypothetical protein